MKFQLKQRALGKIVVVIFISLAISGCSLGKPQVPTDHTNLASNQTSDGGEDVKNEITTDIAHPSDCESALGKESTPTAAVSTVQTTPTHSKAAVSATPTPRKATANPTRTAISSPTAAVTPKKDLSTPYATSATYQPLGNGVMPIGAWIAPPPANIYKNNPNFITVGNYQLAKDAGLNMLYGLYEKMEMNSQNVMLALNAAAETGIKYLVSDANVQAGDEDKELMDFTLNKYKFKPPFLGNLLVDEPALPYFQRIGDIYLNYKQSLPDRIFYVNLMPVYATKNQLLIDKQDESGPKPTNEEYMQYLNSFIAAVHPAFLSYDYYPCMGSFPSVTQQYFDNLSMVRSVCRKENIPFWVFIQTCTWGGNVRVPTKAEILWQVNTALAYGAQGIQYFTFWIPLEGDSWRGGMIDKNGNKTPQYEDVKTANIQIKAIQQVMMNSQSKGIIINGKSPAPIPVGDTLTSYGKLQSISGTPAITGCFDYNGKAVYYVVNNTLTQEGSVTMSFSEEVNATLYCTGTKTNKKAGSITLNLDAGEGVLLIIDN